PSITTAETICKPLLPGSDQKQTRVISSSTNGVSVLGQGIAGISLNDNGV
ncbi:19680_t:CDS:1, partial [Funneliformis geosporum]